MFVSNLIHKRQPRKFTFTPFYYVEHIPEDKQAAAKPRIKFRRLRSGVSTSSKSVKIKIVFAILLVIFLYYFRGLVEAERNNFKIEDIRIEETPN